MKRSIIVLLLSSIVFIACNPSLLEIEQKGVVSEDSYYSSDEDALAASVVIYSTWKETTQYLFFLQNVLSDEVYTAGGTRGDNPFLDALNEYNFVSTNDYISNVYSKMYKLIFYANTLMEKFAEGQSQAIDRCIGEARMARGWAHMQLASYWGNPPLIDHVLTGSDDYQHPNSTAEELWPFIIGDFAEAARLLPSRQGSDDPVRMTREAALSFKGKAEVLSGNMTAAKTTLKQVIDSGVFGLVPSEQMVDLFKNSSNFCKENIFETNVVFSSSTMFNNISGLGIMLCWRGDHLRGIPSYMISNGVGTCNPREEFMADLKAHEEGSVRFKSWFKDWNDLQEMGISLVSPLYGNCGYFQYKYHFGADEIPSEGFGLVNIINWRQMRYAEVLLLYAEACAVAGDSDGSGLKALNDVQKRAGAPETSLSLEHVKTEKKFELFLEGTRFVDLVRWGDAPAVLKDQGAWIPVFKGSDAAGNFIVDKTSYVNVNYGFKAGKHERLPYPEAEIISNQQIKQNPNW